MPQYLTPVAIFTLAVAVIVSSMPPAIVQYLVFAIMFSAPAVGVVAFFAQGVDASDYCNVDWTPVVQTSKRFVVRGGEIPFAAIEPFTFLHLALLVATLAGLSVLWRLVGRFVDQAADDQLSAPLTPTTLGLNHSGRMFTTIYPRTRLHNAIGIALLSLSETSLRPQRPLGVVTSGAYSSTRLDTNPTA
jgi:xanthine/uracil permease